MEWNPTHFFHTTPPPVPYALIVLNHAINENAYDVLKKHACFIICADGGANRFYDLMKSRGLENTELPNAIIGDLDSLDPRVQEHYQERGVTVIKDPDQYSTDFTKAIYYLYDNCNTILAKQSSEQRASSRSEESNEELDIVALGGLGGRVDQGLSQLHHLYATADLFSSITKRPKGELYLLSEESITFLLREGHNTILTPGGSTLEHLKEARNNSSQLISGSNGDAELYFAENIGIVPIGNPSVISTHGLEWDVQSWETHFGGRVSTSNHIRADSVKVETSVPVLFTIELAQRLKLAAGRY